MNQRLPVKAKRVIQNPSKQWMEAFLDEQSKEEASLGEEGQLPLIYVEDNSTLTRVRRISRNDALYLQREIHHWMEQEELIQLDRQIGAGEFAFHGRLYLPSSELSLVVPWATHLPLPGEWKEEPQIVTFFLPQYIPGLVLVDTTIGLTYITGTKQGEQVSKAFMRHVLQRLKESNHTVAFPFPL
ncbi:hypothetical protein [Rubeoparvulum massiliense]|uniref:hypothetical protein n=1 Tax=Rubeoparvulum massiliense TaxID=1631346 RepID=UPI00065E458B|nr:hypothetical protein [Rubeoparvulum massiliense]